MTKGDISVKLFRHRCIACGYCLSIAPEIWVLSSKDSRITSLKTPDYKNDDQIVQIELHFIQEIEQSAKICPVKAIKII
jgi:ferredoxin